MEDLKRYCPHHDVHAGGVEPSWWEHDARGIPLAKVCAKCRDAKLGIYRRDVLVDPNYTADEPIEPDDY